MQCIYCASITYPHLADLRFRLRKHLGLLRKRKGRNGGKFPKPTASPRPLEPQNEAAECIDFLSGVRDLESRGVHADWPEESLKQLLLENSGVN